MNLILAHRPSRLHFATLLLAAVTACSDPLGQFESGLVLDPCNGNYPVCNTVVGCTLTDSSFIQGQFPGSGKFMIQLSGPSTVELHFFLQDPSAAGSQMLITWFESGCTTEFQTTVPGSVFIGEAQQNQGEFVRSQDLTAEGDHLIEFQSDATAQYVAKVVILPKSMGP
jgi:hypothetical protein